MRETRDDTPANSGDEQTPRFGLVVLHSDGPKLICEPLDDARQVGIGRDDPIGALLTDERLSRHHATIVRRGGAFVLCDLGSRNGTFVDGVAVRGQVPLRPGAVIRTGGTIMMLSDEVGALLEANVEIVDGVVRGPQFAAVLAAAARARDPLGISGETGTGKEIVAHAFCGDARFVAVNCATIPDGVAERVLFGAKRGAFSGATRDVAGLIESASGGVVFLDEALELSPAVQAKLIRVMETGEVTPLGSTAARSVRVRFCLASPTSLRQAVESGGFRTDLLFRVRAHIAVPSLQERREEIPHLIAWELARAKVTAHSRLVEMCLLRPWPGNVRELLSEIAAAADTARRANMNVVRPEHLRASAGLEVTSRVELTREVVEQALDQAAGNISEAARKLGLHRTQLKRAMQRHNITAKS